MAILTQWRPMETGSDGKVTAWATEPAGWRIRHLPSEGTYELDEVVFRAKGTYRSFTEAVGQATR